MDEYENMFFAPKSQVIVETENDMEMGEVISHNDIGLAYFQTHRLEIVKYSANEEQRKQAEDLFAEMSQEDLRKYARENGMSVLRLLLWKTERLRKACISFAIYDMRREMPTLMPLSRPVRQMLTYHEIGRITDAKQFIEEKTLRSLDFAIGTEYSETKTKPTEAEPS